MPNSKNHESDLHKVETTAAEVLAKLGFDLVEAKFTQSGRSKCLEVTIHRQNGQGAISLADCEIVSRELEQEFDKLTDEITFFHGSYALDVASPGIDRTLKSEREFQIFKGKKVEVKTKNDAGHGTGVALGPHIRATLTGGNSQVLFLENATAVKDNGHNNRKKKVKEAPSESLKTLELATKNIISVKLYPEAFNKLQSLEFTEETTELDLDDEQEAKL